jgi:hypothetical protein
VDLTDDQIALVQSDAASGVLPRMCLKHLHDSMPADATEWPEMRDIMPYWRPKRAERLGLTAKAERGALLVAERASAKARAASEALEGT